MLDLCANKDAKKLFWLSTLNLGYLLFVIVFGAFVRATKSGAGCGNHWPLCQGEVMVRPQSIETIIELTHRATSGLSLPLLLGLVYLIRKRYAKGDPARRSIEWALLFLILEGLFGAALVKLEHVAGNLSQYRGFSVSLHLVNTFLLTAFLVRSLYFIGAKRETYEGVGLNLEDPRSHRVYLGILVGYVLVSVSGAITALGDTLFPITKVAEAFDLDASSHLFQKLRIYHPFLAVGLALYGMMVHAFQGKRGVVICVGFLGQIALGFLNLQLKAPVWMQLAHLSWAQGVWMALNWDYTSRTFK